MPLTQSEKNLKNQTEQSGSSNLKPISELLAEDIKKYEAFSESKDISFNKCLHKNLTIANGELRCKCGISWSGPRLHELEKILLNR